MLHIYRDPITGEVHKVYDDEPPDDDPEEEETEPEEEEEDYSKKFQRECDRYLNWLYQ